MFGLAAGSRALKVRSGKKWKAACTVSDIHAVFHAEKESWSVVVLKSQSERRTLPERVSERNGSEKSFRANFCRLARRKKEWGLCQENDDVWRRRDDCSSIPDGSRCGQ